MKKLSFAIACIFFATSCENDDNVSPTTSVGYDFKTDNEGWIGNFTDYPKEDSTFYELAYKYSKLPTPLDQTQGALMLTGNNHSDDLFMFAKKKITGLTANTTYKATFSIEVATDAPEGSMGIGGSPANSVYLKAGLVDEEPMGVLDSTGFYNLNIDKGNQAQGGVDMIILGDFSNGKDSTGYVLKTLTNTTPFEVKTNANGELWSIVGSDSGFEGTTTIYYNKIAIKLEKK